MRVLIVEDDATSRFLLSDYLSPYGKCHVAVDGVEAVTAVKRALEAGEPYDLICLDIRMPNMDGQEALKQIRKLEEEKGILIGDGAKVIMTTTVSDASNILEAFNEQCEAYLIKPISEEKLQKELQRLQLVAG